MTYIMWGGALNSTHKSHEISEQSCLGTSKDSANRRPQF